MGKIRFSFLVILVVLAAFACSIPSGVQVKGDATWNFPAISTFDKLFTKQMQESFESDHRRFAVKACSIPTTLTYAMYLPIVNEDQSIDLRERLADLDIRVREERIPGATFTSEGFTLSKNEMVFEGSANEIKMARLPEFLYGFEFESATAKIYTSGNQAADSFYVTIDISDNEMEKSIPVEIDGRNREKEKKARSIALDIVGTECNWPGLLPLEIDEEIDMTELANDNDAIYFDYKIYLKAGEEFRKEWIDRATLRIELVMWLPLVLVPQDHEAGADIIFVDVFGNGKKGQDAFGRGDVNDRVVTDALDWINLIVKLNVNPFENGVIHMVDKSGNVTDIPPKRIKGKMVKLALPEKNMKEVKTTFPFAPDLKIHFDYDDDDPEKNAMRIPRNFRTSTMYLEAGVNYKTDF